MQDDDKRSYVHMAYAGSVGIAFVFLTLGGLLIGNWLDRKIGTSYLFTILLFFAGMAAGVRNVYVLFKKSFRDDQDIITSIKSEPHRRRPEPARF